MAVDNRGPRILLLFAAISLAACDTVFPVRPIGAPADSFTAARWRIAIDGQPHDVDGASVMRSFFTTEDVKPLLGRFFIDTEYQARGVGVVVLSHPYWVERFGSRPAAIGSTIVVDGQRRVIVGIAPPAFQPAGAGSVWIPKAP